MNEINIHIFHDLNSVLNFEVHFLFPIFSESFICGANVYLITCDHHYSFSENVELSPSPTVCKSTLKMTDSDTS